MFYNIVLAAPKMTVAPIDQTLFVHENFSVSCAFNGTPAPTAVWRREENVIPLDNPRYKISSCPTSSVLEINDIQYSDEGQYSCTVTNSLGEDIATMDLFVEGCKYSTIS